MNSILIPTDDNGSIRRPVMHDRCPLAVLYISTDLHVLWMRGSEAQQYARDLRQQDHDRTRIYRRLDLIYYVWLHAQMLKAQQMVAAGRISERVMDRARTTLDLCQVWIEQQFTMSQIKVAIHAGVTTYQPPAAAARVAA